MQKAAPQMEKLEPRALCSDSGLRPAQLRRAYGFDQASFTLRGRKVAADGDGQTIAIVDAFGSPTIAKDVKRFDKKFGISDAFHRGKFFLEVDTPQGRVGSDPAWAQETSLDVEWAHAIAPKAKILLVEAASASIDDLANAIDYARHRKGVSAISLSWGGTEFFSETTYDPILTTPPGHLGGALKRGGITFVSSAGDGGAGVAWPSTSPNVLAVGGTSLVVDSKGNYLSETAWDGSGGGSSIIEGTNAPDVAYDADPSTGVYVYDSTPDDTGAYGWAVVGGTSAGAPQWAALVALADQGRSYLNRASLDGPNQTLNALYHLPSTDFHDITSGGNGFQATVGYDLVTGLGSPIANRVIADLAGG